MENLNRILDTTEDVSSKLGNIPEEIMQKDLHREKEIQNRKKVIRNAEKTYQSSTSKGNKNGIDAAFQKISLCSRVTAKTLILHPFPYTCIL